MKRKAAIIAIVITFIYVIFGQLFIMNSFGPFMQNSIQPEWALSTNTIIAAQVGIYFALGYIIYRNMLVNQLMIRPTIFFLIITFAFWEVFKIATFDWQLSVLAFFLLLCYILLVLLLNLFLFREDGWAGIVCFPISLFSVLYVAPWFYQLMSLNVQQ